MIEIREYIDGRGRSPFGRWFDGLDARAENRVRTALARMEARNLSSTNALVRGVLVRRIHGGPGCRVYFGRNGDTLMVLLGGGTKARQQRDIEQAREFGKSTDDTSNKRCETCR
jgi:putative addiction module killer protein